MGFPVKKSTFIACIYSERFSSWAKLTLDWSMKSISVGLGITPYPVKIKNCAHWFLFFFILGQFGAIFCMGLHLVLFLQTKKRITH